MRCKMPHPTRVVRNWLLQARMSKFNDSSSMWERAKQEHDTSIDKVMKRDWMDNPARLGDRLSPRPVMSAQVHLTPACGCGNRVFSTSHM